MILFVQISEHVWIETAMAPVVPKEIAFFKKESLLLSINYVKLII